MTQKSYYKIVKHYEKCLEIHGDNNLGVDWPNEVDAQTRYKIMLDIIPAGESAILLDFGCGAGHLYEFVIKQNYSNIKYKGLDMSLKFIDLCKRKYPEIEFECIDILRDGGINMEYDYAVLNGVFTEKLELSFAEMFEFFKEVLKILFSKAKKGIAFNVMTKHVDWEREDLFHLPFDLLVSFLKQDITRNFVIRNDYGLYEYTVYLFKEKDSWQR